MKAGVAVADMTPPVGVRLSGFAGRDWRSASVRDPLRATALYIESDGVAGALISLDTIGLSIADDGALRRDVANRLGLSFDAVLIACSHTHAGAATMDIRATGQIEASWTRTVLESASSAAARAMATKVPVAALRLGAAACDASHNRRDPEGPRDPLCRTLELVGADGRRIAALYHYAMHPVCLGSADRSLSADWVGAARPAIEAVLECPTLFLQGCCGDINPRVRDAGPMGGEVASAVLEAALSSRTVAPSLAVAGATAELAFLALPDSRELADTVQRAQQTLAQPDQWLGAYQVAQAQIQWVAACQARRAAGDDGPRTVRARIPLIRLGDTPLIGLPGEVFAQIGMAVQDAAPGAWPIGFAAGNPGYLYPESARTVGGYEVELAYRLYGLRPSGDSLGPLVAAARRAMEALG